MRKLSSFVSLTMLLAVPASANFENKINGEHITISGKVSGVTADSFKLKTKERVIHVEMDDYDWDADGYKLINGDQVVVSGRIDHDFLERKKIEAGSVYVKGINTYFFANSDDEEGPANYLYPDYSGIKNIPENSLANISGKVTKISGREFVVDTGLREVTVDTQELMYNPLDDFGFTKIDKGDFVRVSGNVDKDFFGNKELDANYIVEL